MSTASNPTRLLSTPEEIDALVARAATAPVLCVDTEFERTRTFHARLALIQIHDGQDISLIDVPALADPTPLAALLGAPEPTTVMHAPGEDLEVLQHALGTVPARLFDTQIAAALCGFGAGLGYQRLVQALFEVEIGKEAARSDWLRRPLSPEQLGYAARDVAFLPDAHARLDAALTRLGRESWLLEEVTRLEARVREPEHRRDLLRLARRVGPDDAALARLASLCHTREVRARERNLPRRRVLDDSLLLSLAQKPPADRTALDRHLEGHTGQRAPRAWIREALDLAGKAQPVARPAAAEDLRPHRRALSRLRDAAATAADALDVPAEVLAPRRLLEEFLVTVQLRGEAPSAELQGWRSATLLPALQAALEG